MVTRADDHLGSSRRNAVLLAPVHAVVRVYGAVTSRGV